MNHYLGPWNADGTLPDSCVGSLLLRMLPDGRGERAFGLLAIDGTLGSEHELLGTGDAREVPADARLRSAWETLLGARPEGDTLADLLWSQLTDRSDPAGLDAPRPLVPTSRRELELHYAGLLRRDQFQFGSHPHTERLRSLLQADFAAAHSRDADHARKVLGGLLRKYALRFDRREDWEQFVPDQLRGEVEGPLRPETTITDDFNRPDDMELGTSAEGWSWGLVEGVSLRIDENRAVRVGANSIALHRAEIDLSSPDHFSEIAIVVYATSNVANYEIAARYAADAALHYRGILRNNTSNTWRLFRSDGTTVVQQLGSTVNETPPEVGVRIRVTTDGSTISFGSDAADKIVVTDVGITDNLRTGFGTTGTNSGAAFDDFEARDLAGPKGTVFRSPVIRGPLEILV